MTSLESAVLTFVANALWQAPLLVALAWAGASLLRRAPAAYRHRLWLAALALALVSPVASAARARPGVAPVGGKEWGPAVLGGLLGDAERGAASVAKRLSVPPEYSLGRLGGAAAAVYLLFVLVKAVRLGRAWRRTGRLVRGAKAAPPSVVGVVTDCAAAFGRGADVRVSSEVAAPMTFGLRQPVIVLPSAFARTAAPEALRGALAHELSHVVRHDCAVNLAGELLSLPVSFHPAVRFLKRRLGGAREAACDETAAAFVGPSSYARTLLEVARGSCRPTRFAGALGALDGDGLEDRMKRILDGGCSMGRRQATLGLAGLVLALVVASRLASAAAIGVTTEAGPSDMVGRWTAVMPEGDVKGQPAADLTIALTPNGPDIALTLYRYRAGAEGGRPVAEHPPVIRHGVKNGVLQFRTRGEDFRLRPEDPPSPMEADWEFVVVSADAGQLRLLRNSKLEADKAQGKADPPPAPPLPMKRVSKP